MKIPIVDTKTGKIIDCEKGSNEYNHEQAHISFSQSNLGMKIQYFASLSEFYTIVCICLAFFIPIMRWFSIVGAILMISFFIFEEVYCEVKK